ncbi:MAG TPA: D-alanine--D-alanine ligase family protein [Tepidiformaceae bacterium]|nr:D-alanine--D-alanine ligase family protein [Tepidiformaceae bacterium]
MARQRVAVILGGRSGEHEVSVVSARSVIAALDPERWEVVPFGVTKRGGWKTPDETRRALDEGRTAFEGGARRLLTSGPALEALATCDVAFPLIHGTYGEDGTMQGFFELAGMPYAGAGVAASAIGMDKALMKALFREAGIRQARYAVLRAWDIAANETQAREYLEESLGYPFFVKPANGGSSVGITKVHSREDLSSAFTAALAYDDKLVVEETVVSPREVECSVLGNERPEASVVGEVIPDREFYDYDSKYSATSATELQIPANLDAATSDCVRELAIRMYQVMGCEGYARVDFFVCDGDVLANEVNTIPGFTSISMYPKLWEATGLSYTALLTRILDLAFERHRRRSSR